MCVLIHKVDTADLKGDPSKVADRFYVFLHCMRPVSLGAPGGLIPVAVLFCHRVTVALDDGNLRSVGGRGGSTGPPVHAGADSPGLLWQQDVPVAASVFKWVIGPRREGVGLT